MRKTILVFFTACSLKYRAFALLLLTVFFSFQCSKPKDAAKTEIDQLPPATQNGANTFGCLVNGKAWTPKGLDGNKPPFYVIIDPSFENGNFDLRSYRSANNKRERIILFSNHIRETGVFSIEPLGNVAIDFKSEVTNCYFLHSSNNFTSGFLKITKYDLQNGIVSGEFDCTLYDKTTLCDTVRITNGRFDYKL